jgi:hypothetical protein
VIFSRGNSYPQYSFRYLPNFFNDGDLALVTKKCASSNYGRGSSENRYQETEQTILEKCFLLDCYEANIDESLFFEVEK